MIGKESAHDTVFFAEYKSYERGRPCSRDRTGVYLWMNGKQNYFAKELVLRWK